MKSTHKLIKFSELKIRRRLPKDVFGILHDLAWSHVGQREWKWENMIRRAQEALMRVKVEK